MYVCQVQDTLPSSASGDGLAVHEHVIHGDRQSGVVPMHDHRHAVANQQYVNARTINLHVFCMLLNLLIT